MSVYIYISTETLMDMQCKVIKTSFDMFGSESVNLKIDSFIWHVFTKLIAHPLKTTDSPELWSYVRILRMKQFNLTTGCKALCASGGDREEARSDSWSVYQGGKWTWPVRWCVHLSHCSWVGRIQQRLSQGGRRDPCCQHGWRDEDEPRWCRHHHVHTEAIGARHQAEKSRYSVN